MHGVWRDIDALAEQLETRYGFAPERARAELRQLSEEDLELVPLLLDRLDADVARGGIKNPAGVLVKRLRAIDEWRPTLNVPAPVEAEPAPDSADADPYVRYIAETDARARELLAGYEPGELDRIRARAREHAEARNPAAANWSDAQWATHMERLMIAEVRDQLETYDDWLDRQRRSG